MSTVRLERKISLPGAVFLLVGHIVGASIFILPGELAQVAGPAVFLAYLVAGLPAIVNCLIAAQVGSILPVSAADYVFTALVLNPFVGFLKVWVGMIGLLIGVPILAFGFAEYMAYFLPAVPRLVLATAVVVAILVVNLLGLRASVRTQMLLVSFFVATLLVFGIGGALHLATGPGTTNLVPLVPNGLDSLWSAAVPAFYSYSGFLAIVVIGEEIREPERNIPLTLLFAFAIITTLYALVTFVLPGVLPWREIGTLVAPMSTAAAQFLPPWFGVVITLAAVTAAATSINTLVLTTSRSFFALARSQVLPSALGRISPRTQEPFVAIVFACALGLLGISIQGEILEYASMTVIGSMLYGIVWAVALTRLPSRLPEHYAGARFRVSRAGIWTIAVLKIAISAFFLYYGIRDNPVATALYGALLALGGAYYLLRSRYLEGIGVSLARVLRAETGPAPT